MTVLNGLLFRDPGPMLRVMGNQYTTHKLSHIRGLRFERCQAMTCVIFRESARKAYELYNASGSEIEFRRTMTEISRNETEPLHNMPFLNLQATAV